MVNVKNGFLGAAEASAGSNSNDRIRKTESIRSRAIRCDVLLPLEGIDSCMILSSVGKLLVD
jgi:hypothetical protein